MLKLPSGNAICYSGYREGQSPGDRTYPSLAEIREDLAILRKNWQLLRLYDCSPHGKRVLQVIAEDRLPFRVMLGAYLGAEMNNPGCPWGATYSEEQLAASRAENVAEIERLVASGVINRSAQHVDIVTDFRGGGAGRSVSVDGVELAPRNGVWEVVG